MDFYSICPFLGVPKFLTVKVEAYSVVDRSGWEDPGGDVGIGRTAASAEIALSCPVFRTSRIQNLLYSLDVIIISIIEYHPISIHILFQSEHRHIIFFAISAQASCWALAVDLLASMVKSLLEMNVIVYNSVSWNDGLMMC